MHTLIKTSVLSLALALAACGGDAKQGADKQGAASKTAANEAAAGKAASDEAVADQAEALPSLDPKVEQAVGLANRISAEPENADAILEEAGMDREAFEKLLYEIARDPELSKSYAVARDA